jgi:hypothetical protein
MLATALLRGFHPLAPVIFMVIVAAVLVLAFTGPILRRIRATEAMKSDAYKLHRTSARIETEIELESRREGE